MLFRWGAGRSRGLWRRFRFLFTTCWSCAMCMLLCMLCISPPSVYAIIKSLLWLLCSAMTWTYLDNHDARGFRICCHKVDPFKSLMVCVSARFVFTGIDCLHLWHDRDKTHEPVWLVEWCMEMFRAFTSKSVPGPWWQPSQRWIKSKRMTHCARRYRQKNFLHDAWCQRGARLHSCCSNKFPSF